MVSLVAGINMRALYGSEHPALSSHVDRILEAVGSACGEYQKEALTFLVVGQDLVVENQPLRTGSLYHQQFIRALTRRSVERLTIGRGVDAEECVRFLTPMALGGVPVSTRHIVVGRVELQASPLEGPGRAPAREWARGRAAVRRRKRRRGLGDRGADHAERGRRARRLHRVPLRPPRWSRPPRAGGAEPHGRAPARDPRAPRPWPR